MSFKLYCTRDGTDLMDKYLKFLKSVLANKCKTDAKEILTQYAKIWLDVLEKEKNNYTKQCLGSHYANRYLKAVR